jgi:hypothetical protein
MRTGVCAILSGLLMISACGNEERLASTSPESQPAEVTKSSVPSETAPNPTPSIVAQPPPADAPASSVVTQPGSLSETVSSVRCSPTDASADDLTLEGPVFDDVAEPFGWRTVSILATVTESVGVRPASLPLNEEVSADFEVLVTDYRVEEVIGESVALRVGDVVRASSPAKSGGRGCAGELPQPGDSEILVFYLDSKPATEDIDFVTILRVGVDMGAVNAWPAMAWTTGQPLIKFDGTSAEELMADLAIGASRYVETTVDETD